jgi:hypothetical protein
MATRIMYTVKQYGQTVKSTFSRSEASQLAKRLAREDGYKTLKPAAVEIVRYEVDSLGGMDRKNPCQGSGWKMNPALVFRTKAAARKYAREHGLKGYLIRKNPEGAGRGGKATGAGAGGAGGGAGAGSQGGTSRTEVRSPTRTATSTKAKTWGNITVTGGAGRGATTTVTVKGGGKKKNPSALLFRTRAAALKYAREHGAKRFSIKKLKRGR